LALRICVHTHKELKEFNKFVSFGSLSIYLISTLAFVGQYLPKITPKTKTKTKGKVENKLE
jgi:hypothetical protein